LSYGIEPQNRLDVLVGRSIIFKHLEKKRF
jgi:hypothetical protein